MVESVVTGTFTVTDIYTKVYKGILGTTCVWVFVYQWGSFGRANVAYIPTYPSCLSTE